MGSASAVMKQFMEASSKFWFTLGWKDKIAAGFTNAGSLSGDKNETLHQFATFAAQHGMVWVSFGTHPGYNSTKTDFASARNRTGHALGLATQSLVDLPAEQTPDAADLATAEDFGARVALATQRWVRGRV
jgi:NAD(P)H dehydrogenase (quinone)